MLKSDALRHFGNQVKLAAALEITRSAVSQWGENVPQGRAYQLQLITGGKLRV
ncbi:MAG TPA: Cro/Cl family transcriptional regulator [Rhodospirillales bacterium]|nr:Cro/Cl family transcriptional regulator [Rhodospirillales bacterium]